MPRIVVDEHTCEGLGMCEAMAVDYFEVQPEGLVKVLDDRPAPNRVEEVRAAVESCPVMALKLVDA
ncbi:MAG: ferredoxin [Actinomycetes bacterium]